MRLRLQTIEDLDKEVEWFQWETVKLTNTRTQTDHNRKKLVKHVGSLKKLMNSFTMSLKTFSMHLFVAQWQHQQFQKAKDDLEEGQVLCVMDFEYDTEASRGDPKCILVYSISYYPSCCVLLLSSEGS